MARTPSTSTMDIISNLVAVKAAYLNISYISQVGILSRLSIALVLSVKVDNFNSTRCFYCGVCLAVYSKLMFNFHNLPSATFSTYLFSPALSYRTNLTVILLIFIFDTILTQVLLYHLSSCEMWRTLFPSSRQP